MNEKKFIKYLLCARRDTLLGYFIQMNIEYIGER